MKFYLILPFYFLVQLTFSQIGLSPSIELELLKEFSLPSFNTIALQLPQLQPKFDITTKGHIVPITHPSPLLKQTIALSKNKGLNLDFAYWLNNRYFTHIVDGYSQTAATNTIISQLRWRTCTLGISYGRSGTLFPPGPYVSARTGELVYPNISFQSGLMGNILIKW